MNIKDISESDNFCRVFELPADYPRGFCAGGGKPVNFQMVDWFNPIPTGPILEFMDKVPTTWNECKEMMLEEFLLKKNYVKSGRKYLLITNFDESFIFGLDT